MIISASRRTDIPAFYSKWFMNRIKEGYVMVRNPINKKLVTKVSLNPNLIECIIFWTKNAKPMFQYLDYLSKKYMYYFQYTLNAYGNDLEKNVESLENRINTFKELSRKIGSDRVIWRYDPIVITTKYTINWHIEIFEKLCHELNKYTKTCVFSFVDIYEKNIKQLSSHALYKMNEDDMMKLAFKLKEIALKYNISLKTCSEDIELGEFGISHSCCIDPSLIEKLIDDKLIVKKDSNQRKSCGCIESIDIGEYDTCFHGCIYCYANKPNINYGIDHNECSPLLVGNVNKDDKVVERTVKSFRDINITLF